MDWRGIMDRICSGYRDILGENLLGIYVHGSIAFGCYNPHKSDIDFLVVTECAPDLLQKQHMLRLLMQLAPCAPDPYTSELAKDKVLELARLMTRYCGRMTVNIVSFTEIQEAIRDNYRPRQIRRMPAISHR